MPPPPEKNMIWSNLNHPNVNFYHLHYPPPLLLSSPGSWFYQLECTLKHVLRYILCNTAPPLWHNTIPGEHEYILPFVASTHNTCLSFYDWLFEVKKILKYFSLYDCNFFKANLNLHYLELLSKKVQPSSEIFFFKGFFYYFSL